MADWASTTETNDTRIPPLPKPPGGDRNNKQKRHVNFSEVPTKHQINADNKKAERGIIRSCCSCCYMCFAWSSLIILALVLTLFILGIIFTTFLKSNFPEFRVERITLPRFNVTSSGNKQSLLLNADLDLLIQVSNKNTKTRLSYGPMTVDVSNDQDIKLGQTIVPEFSMAPNNVTVLKLHTVVTKAVVDKDDGSFLKTNYKENDLVLNVVFTGTMSFLFGGQYKMNGLPITVACVNVQQSLIDAGQKQQCSVKLFTFRPSFD